LPAEVESHIRGDFVNACQCAIEVMTKYAPSYSEWVRRVVRYIVVLQRQGDGDYNYSGSSSGDFGLIHVCASPDPVGLAETLVHEAAHQHYYILCRLGSVDDGTDQNAYYSPLVDTTRRIDRILLAYHAVGNIILLARQLRESGAPQSATFSERQENRLFEELRQLEEPLRGNSALTPIGRAILDPLMEHVHRGS
jgi:HEXXH motif-containing protein